MKQVSELTKQVAAARYRDLVADGKGKMEARTIAATEYDVHPNTIYLWTRAKKAIETNKNYQLKQTCLPAPVEAILNQTCTVPWGVRFLVVDGEEWFVARLFDNEGHESGRFAGLVMGRS
jgi:hypothetical protein